MTQPAPVVRLHFVLNSVALASVMNWNRGYGWPPDVRLVLQERRRELVRLRRVGPVRVVAAAVVVEVTDRIVEHVAPGHQVGRCRSAVRVADPVARGVIRLEYRPRCPWSSRTAPAVLKYVSLRLLLSGVVALPVTNVHGSK